MIKTLLICAILVIGQAGNCETKLGVVSKYGVALSIRPRICVLAEGEDICKDNVEVRWVSQNSEPLSVCLYKKNEETPIVCWEKHRSGAYRVAIETVESIAFVLKKKTGTNMLAEKEFEVVHDSKRYRRSRRNPWSFF